MALIKLIKNDENSLNIFKETNINPKLNNMNNKVINPVYY